MKFNRIIQGLLTARGWTQEELAEALSTRQSNVSRWITGVEPRGEYRDQLLALARDSGLLEDEKGDRTLQIMGYVGAGAVIDPEFEQVPNDGLEQVELPYPIPNDLIGFQVKGASMMPKYDPGEILVVAREQPMSLDSMLGDIAVVRTADGRRLVKRIMRGPTSHTYNLESANAETIVGARIVWASPVRMAIPNIGLRFVETTPKRARTRKR